jgi:ribosome recycling factor
LRHARKVGNDEVKTSIQGHETGEDEGHRELDEIQKLTDSCSKRIDEMLEHKEKEVMAI